MVHGVAIAEVKAVGFVVEGSHGLGASGDALEVALKGEGSVGDDAAEVLSRARVSVAHSLQREVNLVFDVLSDAVSSVEASFLLDSGLFLGIYGLLLSVEVKAVVFLLFREALSLSLLTLDVVFSLFSLVVVPFMGSHPSRLLQVVGRVCLLVGLLSMLS